MDRDDATTTKRSLYLLTQRRSQSFHKERRTDHWSGVSAAASPQLSAKPFLGICRAGCAPSSPFAEVSLGWRGSAVGPSKEQATVGLHLGSAGLGRRAGGKRPLAPPCFSHRPEGSLWDVAPPHSRFPSRAGTPRVWCVCVWGGGGMSLHSSQALLVCGLAARRDPSLWFMA